MEITLDELLAGRDKRQSVQRDLIRKSPQFTLICLTVIMPGRVKCNSQSLFIAKEAVSALKNQFQKSVRFFMERVLPTGFEAYLLTSTSLLESKRKVCEIEEQHPLGRLFDIDVIDRDGNPVARAAIGKPERRCLLCDNEARYCMRAHSHTTEELLNHIKELIDSYVQRL
ncbi:MAG: citrate lyase holo-[acyl-carrier protein] synthase [Prevotellaceae bacterium]|nr:citrate lyase holo-[acyl-carrier protein] synthase [Prevotella sp.]MDD7531071.1 citrate lyase holo-[acyl-carrier protein] synthase [Prevotellaceae bacterium]MDY2634505.1 citrate lyase holo-[acyl-carrier protein] synthase [Prevotella sp.]